MRVAHPREQIVVQIVADVLQRVVKDDPVGAAGDRDTVEQIGQAEHGFAGAVHGADAGAAGEHERSIDIEEDEFRHGRFEESEALAIRSFTLDNTPYETAIS